MEKEEEEAGLVCKVDSSEKWGGGGSKCGSFGNGGKKKDAEKSC